METLLGLLTVFGIGAFDVLLAVPAGFFLQFNPILVFTTASLGGIISAIIISFAGENLRERFLKWRYGEKEIKSGRIYQIWNKYGVIGLGMLAPILLGTPLATTLGIALGADKKRLILWMSTGILVWSAATTVAFMWGIDFLNILK